MEPHYGAYGFLKLTTISNQTLQLRYVLQFCNSKPRSIGFVFKTKTYILKPVLAWLGHDKKADRSADPIAVK